MIPLILLVVLAGSILRIRGAATDNLRVPTGAVLLVHAEPSDEAALIARLGEGRGARVLSRSEDWRWLQVEAWEGRQGYARRPLGAMPWDLRVEARFDEAAEAKAEEQSRADKDRPRPSVGHPVLDDLVEDMVEISAGSFVMGDVSGQGGADEKPAHPVRLSAYAIDRLEVSIADYWDCVLDKECAAPPKDRIAGRPYYLEDPVFDDHPVVMVPWSEAKRYCNWRGLRLPTEAEWERAASWNVGAGAPSAWPWGDQAVDGAANLGEVADDGPAPRGTYPEDRADSGALDMAGNVREWVLDWYKEDAYASADASDPRGPSARRGAGSGRAVRGGSFTEAMEDGRAARRSYALPEYGYADVGFRCARDEG